MGVLTYDLEMPSSVPPTKMFKAYVLDAHNLFPKILPNSIKNAEILEGDGGVGTIKLITLGEGSQYEHRVDRIDEANCTYSYSIIEGDVLEAADLEKISCNVKIDPTAEGGSVCRIKTTNYSKGLKEIAEEMIKGGKERSYASFKATESRAGSVLYRARGEFPKLGPHPKINVNAKFNSALCNV